MLTALPDLSGWLYQRSAIKNGDIQDAYFEKRLVTAKHYVKYLSGSKLTLFSTSATNEYAAIVAARQSCQHIPELVVQCTKSWLIHRISKLKSPTLWVWVNFLDNLQSVIFKPNPERQQRWVQLTVDISQNPQYATHTRLGTWLNDAGLALLRTCAIQAVQEA